jgi:spermidine synthase
VGRLSFISTLGSFVGTLVIAYFMVPRLPNTVSVLVIALVLAGMSAAYFIMRRQFGAVSVVALFAVVAGFAISLETSANSNFRYVKELFRGNSHFGRLQVVERLDGSTRYYMNDNLIQNTYDPQLQQSESAFTFMLSGMARAYVTNIEDVLCIGMGVGIVPMDFAKSGARVDLVEINPAVVPVATKFFNFDVSKVNLTIDDGRHFLNRCKKQYDVVVLDAFLGDSSPTHLMTREAFESMRRVLRPGGALVINAFCELEPGRDFFATSLNRTLKSVFSGVRMHTKGSGAIFFTATPRPDPQFVRPPDIAVVHPRVQNEVEGIFNNLADTDPKSGLILTDDYNPAEYYDARNRELIRRHLARGAREM